MGVVDFDPEKWSRANACEGLADVAKVANLAKVSSATPEQSQLSQLSQVAPLPADIGAGLDRLRAMRCPKGLDPLAFRVATLAALGLARDGWAAKALALGWSPLDLFGAVTDATGDAYSNGLAVWLAGRRVLAICATHAIVEDGEGRAYFNRIDRSGARLLWELGR